MRQPPKESRIPSLSTSSIPLSDDFAMDINDADVTDHANNFTPTGKADLEHDHRVAAPPPSRRATVKDVEDDEADRNPQCHVQDWPRSAGAVKGTSISNFEAYRREQAADGHKPWYPFEDKNQWELARWMMASGISQKKMNSFLKLSSVCFFFAIDYFYANLSLS